MMGSGALGGGGPPASSSSSNLSALAPPFTVDRFNLRPPTSNPPVQFSDSQPYAAAAPFNRATWQCSNPSAPTSRPDMMYHNSDLEIDSTMITSVPLGNDYRFGYSVPQSRNDPQQSIPWSTVNPTPKTSSPTFLYDGKLESYYHPLYVSPVVNRDSPLVALSEPRYDAMPSCGPASSSNVPFQVDYTQSLSGLEYQTQWHGGWNGLIDAKRGKRAELNDIFSLDNINAGDSHAYGNEMNQGYHTVECGEILEKDSVISYQQFSDAIGRENRNSLVRMEPTDDISNPAHKVASLPFDSSVATMSSSSFTVPASHPPGSSLQWPKNFMNLQNPYGKCTLGHDAGVSGLLSVTKPYPALVIRPPPSASMPQKAPSGKAVDNIGNVAGSCTNEGLVNNSPFKGKEHHILLNSEIEEGSLFSSQPKHPKEGNGQLFSVPSTVMEELSSNPQTRDGLNNIFKAKSGPQVPNINVSDGSSLSGDCAQAIKSSDTVPDSSDYHSFAVDSPCWKGAPASHFSPSDVVEKETTYPFVKKIDRFYQLDPEVDQNFSVPKDPLKCFSENAGEDKEHEHGHAGRSILHNLGNTSGADCTAGELKPVDAVKARFKGSVLTMNQGIQFCEVYSKTKGDYDLLTLSRDDSESKSLGTGQLEVGDDNHTPKELNIQTSVMDSVLNTSENAEGSVAVHAAENVLCSPPEERAPDQAISVPKMNVQAFVKTLQSLSELLLFNCLTDSSALKNEDFEALKRVINNLDALTSKNMGYPTQPQERISPQQVTYHKVGSFADAHVSNVAGRHHFENVGTKSYCNLDYQNTQDEMGNHTVTQEKTEKFQPSCPLADDLDVLRDDNMAQAIRKVLEENFHSGEEMDSQALLFKNLWLEAEAKLCSISYRARFDRMKIEMQKFKSNQAKENAAASENMSIPSGPRYLRISDLPPTKVEHGSLQKTTIRGLPCLSSTSNVNDVEDSVMARFHILKHRDDSNGSKLLGEIANTVENVSLDKMPFLKDHAMDGRLNVAAEPDSQKKCDVDQGHIGLNLGASRNEPVRDGSSSASNIDSVEASIMTRFNILKCRDCLNGANSVGQQADFVGAVNPETFGNDQPEDGRLNLAVEAHSYKTGDIDQGFVGLRGGASKFESVKDFFLSVPDDPINQSCATYGPRSQYSLGFNDNCSADWEHVLKDDAAWH